MSTTIDQSFVRQYERDVHHIFQRKGSSLRGAVRFKSNVVGKSTTFQKVGKGTATTKARHGVITPMNQDHSPITCNLFDFYAGDWVDALDEAKVNHDERMVIATGGSRAIGRKVDSQILTAADGTTESTISWTVSSYAAVRNSAIQMVEALADNDALEDDDDVYATLTPRAYAMLMTVKEFSSADYVSTTGLPFTEKVAAGTRWKDWMGVKWKQHTGSPGKGTATAKVFAWHKMAIGYAAGKHAGNVASNPGVTADITWHGDRASHFVNHMMSGGACLIDTTGVIEGNLDDTQSIPTS